MLTQSAISAASTAIRDVAHSPPVLSSNEVFQQILDRIVQLSRAAPPPAKWASFGSHRAVRRLTCAPEQLLVNLSEQFTADQLLVARVAQRTKSGELKIASAMDFEQGFLVRGDANGAADIVTQRGTLLTGTSEWRNLAAKTTGETSARQVPIVLAASEAELYVLVKLGIRCTALAGMNVLSGDDVRALFSPSAKQPQQRCDPLVLLGWRPGALINAPLIENLAAIRRVAAIKQVYDLDPHTACSVWMPGAAEMTRIRRAHSFVDRTLLAAEFRSSLRKSLYSPADALALLADRTPSTWSEARASLQRAIDRSGAEPQVAEANVALKKLKRAFCRQVMHPLEAAAGQTGLPALHSLVAAELARRWYENLELVGAARRIAAGQFPRRDNRLDEATLNRDLQLVNAIVKLSGVKF